MKQNTPRLEEGMSWELTLRKKAVMPILAGTMIPLDPTAVLA